jgi:hypothetical protein
MVAAGCATDPNAPGGAATVTIGFTPTTTPEPTEAAVGQLTLASYRRVDPNADPKGGGLVYIVDQDVTVRTEARGIKRLDVLLARSARDTAARASVVPDSSGEVSMRLHLPRVGEIYVVQATGVLADQRRDQSCAITNERNECVVAAQSALRVKAEP